MELWPAFHNKKLCLQGLHNPLISTGIWLLSDKKDEGLQILPVQDLQQEMELLWMKYV